MVSSECVTELDELYERARRLLRGFASKYKSTMSRLVKYEQQPSTIERLREGLLAVLSLHGLSEHDACVLDGVHAELRAARGARDPTVPRMARALADACAARDRLIAMGGPPSLLPELEPGAALVGSARRLVTAVYEWFAVRGHDDRAAIWMARMAVLAEAEAIRDHDALRAEEAAALVELICQWGADLLAADEHTGTQTLTGLLAAPGPLAPTHLERVHALERSAVDPSRVSELACRQAWLNRYPFALHVVATRRFERVLGAMTVLPITHDSFVEAMRSGDDLRVPPARLARCVPGERVYVYVPSIVLRDDCDRSKVKNELRLSFLRGLIWLRARGVVIDAIVAIGATRGGRNLLRDHDFEPATELTACVGDSPLLGGDRQLYALYRTDVPRTPLGVILHAPAFGS